MTASGPASQTAARISVIIPTLNGEDTLRECLDGIYAQETAQALDVLVIDSGSTDRSLEICRDYPLRVLSIDSRDFSHGDTRNLGAMETEGEFIVFTVQDAVPADRVWLKNLIAPLLRDQAVAGAYSRTVPRTTCGPLVERGVKGDLNFRDERIETRFEHARAPDDWHPHTRRVEANFNDVASVLRRSVWEKLPYQRTPFAEDIIWADSVLRAGYKIVFEPTSVIIHSHEYQTASIYPRTHIDAWFNRAYFDYQCIEKFSHVLIQAWRQFKEDRKFLSGRNFPLGRRIRETATSLGYHFMEFFGFYLGGRVPGKIGLLGPTRKDTLRLLLAVSDKEPGAETRARELGEALRELGHEVTFALESQASQAGAGQALTQDPPDLVHCLDFGTFTADLAAACYQAGLPFLVTLSDFWFRCPRASLIRSDGELCTFKRPPGLGCAACQSGLAEFSFPFSLAGNCLPAKAGKLLGLSSLSRMERLRNLLQSAEFLLFSSYFIRTRGLEAGLSEDRLAPHPYSAETSILEPIGARWNRLEPPLAGPAPVQGESVSPARMARALVIKYRQALSRRAIADTLKDQCESTQGAG